MESGGAGEGRRERGSNANNTDKRRYAAGDNKLWRVESVCSAGESFHHKPKKAKATKGNVAVGVGEVVGV